MKTITIRIDVEGDVKIEVNGVTGEGCKVLTEAFENAYGGPDCVNSREETADYYQLSIDQNELVGY